MSKVNLNKASKVDILTNISGIGEEMADAIVRYREEKGGFKNLNEVDKVPGISDVRAQKAKDNAEL